MIYLSGVIREEVPEIGFMITPNSETRAPEGRTWAADNGRFAAPAKYTDERFIAWLSRRNPTGCLFATAPDILGNHKATIDLSTPMLAPIRRVGFKVAFVAQDGFDAAPWDQFDCLFIGGTDAFKLGDQVPAIVSEARSRGKWVHMGRVNSSSRLRVASAIGCHSADGTFIKFAPDKNVPRMVAWLRKLQASPLLDLKEAMP